MITIKSGFTTSEFFASIFAGAICGGAAYLGHPLDWTSLAGLLGAVVPLCLYIRSRYKLKQALIPGNILSVLSSSDPTYKQDIDNVLAIIQPLVVAEIKKHSEIGGLVANHEINKVATGLLDPVKS